MVEQIKAYQATVDEAVEAHVRVAELVGSMQRARWSLLTIPPVIALVAAIFLFDELEAKLFIGLGTAVLVVVFNLLTFERTYRRMIRRTLVRAFGDDQPMPSEFELTDSGLVFRRPGQELKLSWGSVRSVTQTETAIEVVTHPAAVARIPHRVFDDPAERDAWLRFIEERSGSTSLDRP